jgi:hypothetical protein
MRSSVPRFLHETNLILLAIIALAVLQLSPLLDTGYLSDDAGNSLIRGILQYHHVSLAGYCYGQCQRWMFEVGRFYPLIFLQIYATFYLFPNLCLYKWLVVGLVVADLLLFARFVRSLTGRAGFAELSSLAVLVLFQFSYSDDPLLGYSGLLPEIFLCVILSLSWLYCYLENGKRRWLIASTAAYLIGILTYEILYPFFFLHLALVWSRNRSWKSLLTISLPFILCALLCAGVSLLLRCQVGDRLPLAYKVDPRWRAYIMTLVRQLDGALPLSHYFCPPDLMPRDPHWHWVSFWSATAFLGCFPLSLLTLYRVARSRPSPVGLAGLRPVGFGLALWFLPALLVCSSYQYQGQIRWGMPQISVYIEHFGAGLIIASGIAWGVVRLASRKGWLFVYTGIISALLSGVLAITNQANREVTRYFSNPWHDQRLNLEAALKAGIAEEIPDHSTVIVQHRYPWWHDLFVAYFYYQNAGKKLHFAWIPPGNPDLLPGREIAIGLTDNTPPNGLAFALLDGVADRELGYVLLGLSNGLAPASDGVPRKAMIAARLFVHGRGNAKLHPEAALPLLPGSKAMPGISTAGLTLIREGTNWALYLWPIDSQVLTALRRSP